MSKRPALLLLSLVLVGSGCAVDAGAAPAGRRVEPTVPAPTVAPAPPLAALDEVEAVTPESADAGGDAPASGQPDGHRNELKG